MNLFYSFLLLGLSINFPKLVIYNIDIVTGTKYLIKLKWWIHCSSNFFRRWTAKLLMIRVCLSSSIFALQSKLTEFSAIFKQQQNDNTSRLVSCQKRGQGRGQLQTADNYKIILQVRNWITLPWYLPHSLRNWFRSYTHKVVSYMWDSTVSIRFLSLTNYSVKHLKLVCKAKYQR